MAKSYVYIGMAGEAGLDGHGIQRMDADGGDWTELTNGLPADPEVRALALQPGDSSIVFAGTNDGVYRSDDSGDHWERLDLPRREDPVWSLMFNPADAKTVYAGYGSPEVFRSDDGGERWRPLRIEVQFPSVTMRPRELPKRVIGMSAASSQPDEIYAAIEVGGLVRSTDGGESWESISEGFYVNDDPVDAHGVVASGARANTVHAITRIGMFRSSDSGEHWDYVDIEKLGEKGTYCRSLREAPDDPSTLYLAAGPAFMGDTGALYRSRDTGDTWQRIALGRTPKSTMFGVAVNRADSAQMYCATLRGEVFGSRDGGATWSDHPLPEGVRSTRAIVCG
jgi:photosystem II stability/assembly factor-like uncharacterized protein